MMNNDYRVSRGCSNFANISLKKKSLKEEIISTSGVRNDYNAVRDDRYKGKFYVIYNKKCAYCGISTKIVGLDNFQVDHFISVDQFNNNHEGFKEDFDINAIENLMSACWKCNNAKREFKIKPEYYRTLNPDLNPVLRVFSRDSGYRIVINEDFKEDKYIQAYYEKLQLYSNKRRLDFVLLELIGLLEDGEHEELANIIFKLQRIRNNVKYDNVMQSGENIAILKEIN